MKLHTGAWCALWWSDQIYTPILEKLVFVSDGCVGCFIYIVHFAFPFAYKKEFRQLRKI